MATRLTVQPVIREKATQHERRSLTRRLAWLTVFAASALFWVVVAWMIWS
ncbi:YmiA family putative membrane protein [Pantoea sp. B65]